MIKKFFLVLILIMLSSVSESIAESSSKFDGAYTYTHFCKGDDNSKFDGSQFIIKNGVISNDRGGGGRWIIKKEFKIDDDGKLKFRGVRKDRKYTVKGKLIIDGENITGKLSAKRHPKNSGGSYKKCEMVFKRVGNVPEKISFEDNREIVEINILSKNTNDDIALLNDEGKDQEVRVELRNLESISKGLIIVVPSSTPNMEDELYYEKQVSEFKYATAIVYGAEPRYQKKFTGSYTSSMILYDAISTINHVSKQFSEPKEVVIMGSSTGSLAV